MKKNLFFSALMLGALVLAGCNGTSDTPSTTTTKLWPAYNTSAELYGYIDAKGKWAIPAQFTEASSFFSAGYAIVKINGQNAFIDTKGAVQNCVSFDSASPFLYGYSLASLNGKYGLINTKFEFAIQPVYSGLTGMSSDGLVTYQAASDKYGFLDKNGKVQLDKNGNPLYFESAGIFRDGYCVVCSDLSREDDRIPTYQLINKKGEATISEGQYMYMQNLGLGIVGAVKKDKDAYYSREGQLIKADGTVLSSKTYNDAGEFSADKVAYVGKLEGDDIKYGYIDEKGNEVVSLIYDNANVSSEGFAWVRDDKTWKLLEVKKGNIAFACKEITDNVYERPLCGVHNGLTLVGKTSYSDGDISREYRWVDTKGNTVFSWNYDQDKYRGDLEPAAWAPARKQNKIEIDEYVFLK